MRTIAEDVEGAQDLQLEDIDVGVIEHSLPRPEEVYKEPDKTASKWRLFSVICIVILIIIAIVGFSVGLSNDGSGSNTIENAGSATRYSASNKKRRIRLQRYLVSQGVNAEEEFLDPSSPQSLALDFLAFEDKLKPSAPSGDLTSKEGYTLLTRYVMTVFYYAMNGENWNFDLLFLSEYDTCLWYSVFEPPIGQLGVICNDKTNEITGFSFIGDKLSGELPKEISHLTTLSYMESIGNDVRGRIPNEFSRLTNLRTMVFAWNKLTGSIPAWFDRLKKLEFLYLSNNVFTGVIPPNMQALSQLRVLALNDNGFNGPLNTVWQLPKIEYLFLQKNLFTGNLPESISAVSPQLINIDFSDNELAGSLPADLFDLTKLEILDLHDNSFSGPIPYVNNNETERVLEFVALHQNKLAGAIPDSLGNLKSLKHLDLSQNHLYGPIPILSSLSDLEYLFLAENDFNPGSIPNFLFSLSNLKELSLKSTKRRGPMQDLFKLLDKLVVLDLDNNDLTGTLPTELGTLEKLEFLLLNRNQFSNTVPTEYAGLTSLRMALLNGNDITGSLDSVCQNQNLEVAVSDCQKTECTCCELCCSNSTVNCHDYDQVASYDPSWETSYDRRFFAFSDESRPFPIPQD